MDAIPIPEVEYHEEKRSLSSLGEICQEYAEENEKPCTTVEIDGKVCYAYMELDGTSHPVQCFIRLVEKNDALE